MSFHWLWIDPTARPLCSTVLLFLFCFTTSPQWSQTSCLLFYWTARGKQNFSDDEYVTPSTAWGGREASKENSDTFRGCVRPFAPVGVSGQLGMGNRSLILRRPPSYDTRPSNWGGWPRKGRRWIYAQLQMHKQVLFFCRSKQKDLLLLLLLQFCFDAIKDARRLQPRRPRSGSSSTGCKVDRGPPLRPLCLGLKVAFCKHVYVYVYIHNRRDPFGQVVNIPPARKGLLVGTALNWNRIVVVVFLLSNFCHFTADSIGQLSTSSNLYVHNLWSVVSFFQFNCLVLFDASFLWCCPRAEPDWRFTHFIIFQRSR